MSYKRISPVPVIEGGTQLKTWGTAYSLLCAGTTVTAPVQVLPSLGASNTILTSGGAGALPVWTTAVYPATTTTNQLLWSNGANNVVGLATANSGTLITSAGGVPSISTTLPATVQGNITATGALASGSLATGFSVVSGALGGTGVANTGSAITIGGNVTFSGAYTFTGTLTNTTSVTFPTSGTLVNSAVTTLSSLVSVGALSTGSLAAGFTPVTVPIGGTGNTTFTAYSVICAGTTATGTFQNVSGLGSSGNVLTSNGNGALPTWQAATGTGTVNSGTINDMAYYAATGTAVSGLATANNGILVTSGAGVPSIATTFGQGLAVASSQLSVGAANNIPFNTTKGIQDNSGNSLLLFTVNASSVNYINITNNSTTNSPIIAATGSDTNVLLTVNGKGNSGVGIQGTAAGGNATAGYVGEFVSSLIPIASNVPITTATAKNLTSISLTAGDWDIYGNISFNATGYTLFACNSWISSTSATIPDVSLISSFNLNGAFIGWSVPTPIFRVSISSTTTYYLSGLANFSSGSANMCGNMYARRVR
jgi:hypothetical protein